MKIMARMKFKSFMLAGANLISGKTGTDQATVLSASPLAGAIPTKETP
jgi:hypothetical protein